MDIRIGEVLPRLGSRVRLRRLSADDLHAFQAYRSDPEVGRFQGWSPMPSTEAAEFLAEMSAAEFGVENEWLQIGIADRATDRLIGDLAVRFPRSTDGRAEIGFTLAREAQGRGLGAEAPYELVNLIFEHTALTRVIAVTDARNLAAVRLLRRVGMTFDDTVAATFRGAPCTEYVFAINRSARTSRGTEPPLQHL